MSEKTNLKCPSAKHDRGNTGQFIGHYGPYDPVRRTNDRAYPFLYGSFVTRLVKSMIGRSTMDWMEQGGARITITSAATTAFWDDQFAVNIMITPGQWTFTMKERSLTGSRRRGCRFGTSLPVSSRSPRRSAPGPTRYKVPRSVS